jgi:hypothetical protein
VQLPNSENSETKDDMKTKLQKHIEKKELYQTT